MDAWIHVMDIILGSAQINAYVCAGYVSVFLSNCCSLVDVCKNCNIFWTYIAPIEETIGVLCPSWKVESSNSLA